MTDYARKMSLDLRMIDENGYSDHIDNKASHCAKLLNDYYQKYDAQKGTQFVFSDLGTYKSGGDFNIYPEHIRRLPIPIAPKAEMDALTSLAKEQLAQHAQLKEAKLESDRSVIQSTIAALDAKIDAIVYKIYGLSQNEIEKLK